LNVLQLTGWTAVMIYSGGAAARFVVSIGGDWVWSIVIGALIIVWILIGMNNLDRVNAVAMSALFILSVILSMVIFRQGGEPFSGEALRFGAAVELSAAMPLSWLPLISDYTRAAKKPVACAVAYFIASSLMYIIGMGAAIFTGESDVAAIMVKAGLGAIALLIIVFSTVTTTFLDAYSAGVSSGSISGKLKEKPVAVVVCLVGILLAVLTPIARFEGFLYLIGSVFAPMTAILLVDYYVLREDSSAKSVNWVSLALWLTGFILYRFFMRVDTPVGNTAPVMLLTAALRIITSKIIGRKAKCSKKC
jgi:putative hydroxymethylpyrimidine transporter CytX